MSNRMWIAALVIVMGCGGKEAAAPPEGADASHEAPITEADVSMPASYSDAVPQIVSYRDAIRSAIERGTPEDAHRPLDELEIVLGKLPSIAKQSEVPKEHWETINLTARALRELFNQLHAAIDEHRQPNYDTLRAPIDEAIAKLDEVTR